jgi:hypothetical protein
MISALASENKVVTAARAGLFPHRDLTTGVEAVQVSSRRLAGGFPTITMGRACSIGVISQLAKYRLMLFLCRERYNGYLIP